MKQAILILAMMLLTVIANAQSRFIDFNSYSSATNNDLANNFNYTGVSQSIDSGITGGAVRVPLINGSLEYKTIIDSPDVSQPVEVSLFFKFDGSIATNTDKAVIIAFNPVGPTGVIDTANGIGYFFRHASGTWPEVGDQQGTTSGSIININPQLAMVNKHWYKLAFSMYVNRTVGFDYIIGNELLEDYGTDGLSTPVLILGSNGASITANAAFMNKYRFSIQVKAAKNCGITYLDDMKIVSKQFLAVGNTNSLQGVKIFPTEVQQGLTVSLQNYYHHTDVLFRLFDNCGRCVFQRKLQTGLDYIVLPEMPSGTYVARINSGSQVFSQKIVKR